MLKPKAIICDLDESLCLIGDREPYRGDLCESDLVNHAVLETLDAFQQLGHMVILLSARTHAPAHQPTVDWLTKHAVPYNLLIMKQDDVRRGGETASAFKEREIRSLQETYDIVLAIEDDSRVIRKLAAMNIPSLCPVSPYAWPSKNEWHGAKTCFEEVDPSEESKL